MTQSEQLGATDEVVVCDFDGTITNQDACDQILATFANGDWQAVGKSYEEGAISHAEMNTRFIEMLTVSPKELELFIKRNIKVREDFNDFILACKRLGIMPVIISSGWDSYIKTLLSDLNVVFPKSLEDLSSLQSDCLPVVCNHIRFDEASASWQVEFPFAGSQQSSPDKTAIVNHLRNQGVKNIIAVGDGLSDRGMARAADLVFSRDILTEYCKGQGIETVEFDTFGEVESAIEDIKSKIVRLLSLPSYHPYNKRFDNRRDIAFANPNSDCFAEKDSCTPEYFEKNYPPEGYDVVHIHFEYYLIPVDVLENLLKYFKKKNKPIVWTCHDRRSLVEESPVGEYEQLLSRYADGITTLTEGCSKWLKLQYCPAKSGVKIIPHGYLAHPSIVEEQAKEVPKDRNLFTMLIGDFRKSKEFIHSIRDFLECEDLSENARLQIIFRTGSTCPDDSSTKERLREFQELIKNPRITAICMENIPDEVIIKAFVSSHAVILPYLWGTHSGQLEMARDCGCHVVVSDVGYYKEQWNTVRTWAASQEWDLDQSRRYQEALTDVYIREPLKPAGYGRLKEFEENILRPHLELYNNLTSGRHS
ncbi:MAG: hypothetical protein ACD_15C00235G0003 [uncultured bacterium]|nr:MAG: hypothetical protein ACD_15C00235G0003 [uncultured bacterium]